LSRTKNPFQGTSVARGGLPNLGENRVFQGLFLTLIITCLVVMVYMFPVSFCVRFCYTEGSDAANQAEFVRSGGMRAVGLEIALLLFALRGSRAFFVWAQGG